MKREREERGDGEKTKPYKTPRCRIVLSESKAEQSRVHSGAKLVPFAYFTFICFRRFIEFIFIAFTPALIHLAYI